MERVEFTDSFIESIETTYERFGYLDTLTPGLGLYLRSDGLKLFRFHGVYEGSNIRVGIGAFPDQTLEEVRAICHAMNEKIAQGVDPRRHRTKREVTGLKTSPPPIRKRNQPTRAFLPALEVETVCNHQRPCCLIGDLAADYIENHLKVHSSKETWRNVERSINNYFHDLIGRRVCEVTRRAVKVWHGEIGNAHGKTTANRAVQLLSSIINNAIDNDLVISNLRNPCQRIRLFRLQSRDRYLNRDEVSRLLTAIDRLRYETTQHFLLMCLFTGQRRSNVAAMKFSEIDLDKGVWRIPRTKNGDPHIVPLIEPAVSLLKERLEMSQGREHVFWSDRSETGHLTRPENAWSVVCERAQISDARIHDLRRTLASWAAGDGTSVPVLAKMLGHKNYTATAIYARLDTEPVRHAMSKAIHSMGASPNQAIREPV